ncbi:MAG: DUF6428 family protein, partial [Balneolales bacterium]|nr:DUF6428 family protein [Balneolales bacterium]
MKTIDFLHTLNHSNKKLSFLLPGSEVISGDLHITEVKNTHIISTDCGGNSHEFEETVIQLWINENSGLTPKWTTK